ncbi:LuxR C-terminal-related transcriptional regulator [Saccharothrix sp. S26]|uniref:response regulator transcription factor n=1 Tax=Saccharothrix sp. S26 TaxID=2907215 RepID=UPI001F162F52|nr:LuxR C-terminal-related transcriptional regulator [Saccharothrix sp. S26]MCE6998368.1 LuxR C-terminal-related transcriptional regulator [Saccharothrix sp. S26]
MSTTSSGEGEKRSRDIVELLRRLQAHQQEAQQLLALAEQISKLAPVEGQSAMCGRKAARAQFTEREKNVVDLLTQGMSNRTIARALDISERTVKNHLNSIFHKLGVADRTQAVIALMRGAEE